MGLGYLYVKYILLALLAIATIIFKLPIQEFGIYFGILLIVGVALTTIYLFIHFDKNINQKLIIELGIDAFAGLVIFTTPEPTVRFFMLDFSFWIAVMGMLHFTSGLFDHKNSNLFWLYIISGIMFIVFGFIILNYSSDYLGSVMFLIGIVLAYFAFLNIYYLKKNKS